MTPKPKTPTASGISRLLAKAGFERAVETRKSRNAYENTAGFHVKARLGTVLVNHWDDSGVMPTPETIAAAREMLACYAEDIRAAGWAVEDRNHMLIVTAKAED
jgi:hypothetical protein